MNEGLIQKTIQRSNRILLLISIGGLLIVAGLFIYNINFLYNFVFGPFDVEAAELEAATSASAFQKYWVNVSGQAVLDVGAQYVSESYGKETVEASYAALGLTQRLLLVKLPGSPVIESLPLRQTGWLNEINSEERREIILSIEGEEPEIQGVFLPYKLEIGDFRATGVPGFVIAAALIVLSIIGLVTVLRRSTIPDSHPILKRLSRFGPVDFVVSRIEAELAAPHTTLGKLHLTTNWLVYSTAYNVLATRHEDVAWIYKHVTSQRTYGITVSKTYSAMLRDRSGAQLQISAGRKEQSANEMLQAILERAPWAIAGYSDDLMRAWNKDRSGFLAAVDRRKTTTSQ